MPRSQAHSRKELLFLMQIKGTSIAARIFFSLLSSHIIYITIHLPVNTNFFCTIYENNIYFFYFIGVFYNIYL